VDLKRISLVYMSCLEELANEGNYFERLGLGDGLWYISSLRPRLSNSSPFHISPMVLPKTRNPLVYVRLSFSHQY
jgi:hypothetical protein